MTLTAADDFFHAPTTDAPWWSETYWFCFDDPSTGLSGTFYPLLRRNLGVAALTVAIWSPGRDTAWLAPYYRSLWHLRAPEFDGKVMTFHGLRYEILEPLNRYAVRFEDAGRFSADLVFTGITDNYVVAATPGGGHWDQPCSVRGTLDFGGARVELDCFGMRDRSWGPRQDDATTRASYIYGINAHASFLVVTRYPDGAASGYVEMDGARVRVIGARHDIERDGQRRAIRTTIELMTADGGTVRIRGHARNHLAKQATPGHFAWMSMFAWDFAGESFGEYQDVWSPDLLAAENRPTTL